MVNVNIYIIHYTKLVKRESLFSKLQLACRDLVENHNIHFNIKIITKFDPEVLDKEFIDRIYEPKEFTETSLLLFNQYIISQPQSQFISNCLKHMDAMNQIWKNAADDDINIVIEDDVVFDSNLSQNMKDFIQNKKYMQDESTPYDIVFFGLPGNNENVIEKKDNNEIVTTKIPNNSVLPCCDSYFITKETAKTLAKSYTPLKFPNNVQLSYVISKNMLNVGKTFPNIMADGSKIGICPSSLSPNNILMFNPVFKEVYKIIQKPEPTIGDIEKVKQLLDDNPLKESPDFIFLRGLYLMRIKEYKQAKSVFDTAIKAYEENMSPLNNNSAIINNYIDLCKHTQ